jgi:hypothetical protein
MIAHTLKIRYVRFFCLLLLLDHERLSSKNSLNCVSFNILSLPFVTPRAHDIEETRGRERKRSLTISLSYSSSVFCRVENKFFCVV